MNDIENKIDTETLQPTPPFLAQTETVLNEKALVALSRHTMKMMAVLMAGVAVVFVFLGTALLLSGYDKFISILFIAAGAVVPFAILLATYLSLPKTVVRTQKNILGLVQTVSFGDKVYVKDNSPLVKSDGVEFSWDYLAKANETQDYFFIFINKFLAYIIDKSAFTTGSPEVLRALLKEKLGDKFKTKF